MRPVQWQREGKSEVGFKSFILLGTQLILYLFRLLWPFKQERGAEQFLESYRADYLRPISDHERKLVPLWQRCTNCGLCEAVCPLDTLPDDRLGLSYNRLASSAWRDITAHRLVLTPEASLEGVDCVQVYNDIAARVPAPRD